MQHTVCVPASSEWPLARLWGPPAFALPFVVAALVYSGFRFDISQIGGMALWLFASFVLVRNRHRLGGNVSERLIDFSETFSLFCAISALGAVASYVAAARSTGYFDVEFARIDAALGFNWLALCRFTAAHPYFQREARWAYASIFIMPVVVLSALCGSGRSGRARRFIRIYAVALAITITLFLCLPAAGPLTFYGANEQGFHPAVSDQAETIEALRSGALRNLDLATLKGLVSVPSFHAVSAVLFTWAVWPVRFVRWPVALVNVLMLAVTPIEGNHYLIDVIAGCALAALVVCCPLNDDDGRLEKVPSVVPDIPVIHRLTAPFFAFATRARGALSLGDRDGGPGLSRKPATAKTVRQVTKGPISADRQ